jgi:putative transposase
MNEKTLKVPLEEWSAHVADPPQAADAADGVLLNFLPDERRRLTLQGVELFALHYYAPWLGVLVPERDRLGSLDVRYDPRDISRIYVRDPSDGQFRVGDAPRRRDGLADTMRASARSPRKTGNASAHGDRENRDLARDRGDRSRGTRDERADASLYESRGSRRGPRGAGGRGSEAIPDHGAQ